MQMKVQEYGDGYMIQLSKETLESVGITMNELLKFKGSGCIITLIKSIQHKTLKERTNECSGQLALDTEFDWGNPVGREVW